VSALCPGPTRTEFGEVAGFKGTKLIGRLSMDAEPVVRAGLEALDANRAVAITGVVNKAGALSIRFLPRSLVRKLAGAIKF
jgi:hypothetical protein